ncbi:hypothetical protein [Streptomyces sp. NPDC094049]|uniref:hypothetical protein n=1 Tax=Streptomyces sp. NPDC094049 TaxID=3154987 RepID=UPI003325B922
MALRPTEPRPRRAGEDLRRLAHVSLDIASVFVEEAQRTGASRPDDPVQLVQAAFSTPHGPAALGIVGGLLDGTPYTGQGTGSPGARVLTRTRPPSTASSMNSGGTPENTIYARSLISITPTTTTLATQWHHRT